MHVKPLYEQELVIQVISENNCNYYANFTDIKVKLSYDFSHFSLLDSHVPNYDEAHAACIMCTHLNSYYAESEITTLIP